MEIFLNFCKKKKSKNLLLNPVAFVIFPIFLFISTLISFFFSLCSFVVDEVNEETIVIVKNFTQPLFTDHRRQPLVISMVGNDRHVKTSVVP